MRLQLGNHLQVQTGSDSLLELPACVASLGKWPVQGHPAHRHPFLGVCPPPPQCSALKRLLSVSLSSRAHTLPLVLPSWRMPYWKRK